MAAQSETQATCDEAAEPVGLAYGDHTVGCTINPPGDIDRFQFEGTVGDQIRINVLAQSLSFAPLLEVYDPSFVKIAEESCLTNYCSITLELTLPTSGPYTLFVSDVGNNNAGNYTLQLERIVPPPVSIHLDYDSSSSDAIDPATDVDFYSFHATAGTQIRFNVLANSLSFSPVVEIRDQNGTLVVDGVTDGAYCNSNYCSFSVDLSPALTGNFSLLIYDLNTNNPGNYELSLWCLVGPCDSDGNGIPDANPPAVSYDSPVVDSISPAVDGDFYTFHGTPGTDIRLNVLATSLSFAPVVEIRRPDGSLAVNGAVDGASCNSNYCSFSVDLSPELAGNYSLLIYDLNTNNPGGYQLSLWCLVGPCDSDGNGTPDADPPPVSYVTPVVNTISPAVDGDIYVFHGTPGTDIRLNVLATSLSFAPVVEIRAPNGTLVLDGVADGASCNTNYCSFSVDLSPALAGRYSLLIYDLNTNNPGGYQLSLWCLAGDCDSDADGVVDGKGPVIGYGGAATEMNSIDPAVDGDQFIFGGTAGDFIRFNVLAKSLSFAPVVEIRDPNDIVVINGCADGACCSTNYCSFSVNLSPTSTGTYTLLIYDLNTNNPGNYDVSLQCLLGTCGDATPICGDNCIDAANDNQLDTDGDGYGNICDGDLNNDGTTNTLDLNLYKLAHRTVCGDANYNLDADFNADCRINTLDLNIYKGLHRKPPGPSCPAP
jgi:hypothetical protein